MSAICDECCHGIRRHIREFMKVMKRNGLKLAIAAIVVSSIFATRALAESAAVRNCTWCHGADAQGYTVAPRLAGQRPQYMLNQIQSFHDHTRDGPFSRQYMWSAVASLGPGAARDLANYFASIQPKPANDGDGALAAKGKRIFTDGIPEANVVSCYACHGPNGEGIREIPRLGGLAYFYIKARLEQWNKGYHSTAGSPMPLVASHLGPDEIEALASYLSFVK